MDSITMTLQDRSAYLKGLVLLARKDHKVALAEAELVAKIGTILGFHKGFSADAVNEVLGNRYIVDEPPVFSQTDVAGCFLLDGLTLSSCDDEVHVREFLWLRSVAAANNIDFDSVVELWQDQVEPRDPIPFQAERLKLEN